MVSEDYKLLPLPTPDNGNQLGYVYGDISDSDWSCQQIVSFDIIATQFICKTCCNSYKHCRGPWPDFWECIRCHGAAAAALADHAAFISSWHLPHAANMGLHPSRRRPRMNRRWLASQYFVILVQEYYGFLVCLRNSLSGRRSQIYTSQY